MTVRVVVVDDSVVVRRTVADVLGAADDIEVVGTASDGRLGLRKIADLKPDVVTLDVEMPGMGGLEALAHLRRDHPELAVIMYSTLTERGAAATFEALALGAVDYATKPSGAVNREAAASQVRDNLLPLVRLWGRRAVPRPRKPAPVVVVVEETTPLVVPTGRVDLVVIGVSTGGPDALAALVPAIRADLPVPVVVVQHMPPVFTTMLAQRLDNLSGLHVAEAQDGETARAGNVYLAPGGQHVEVRRGAGGLVLTLSDAPPENSCRPAVDVLFRTAATATQGRLLGVVLTGMGQDGLIGSQHIRTAGGAVLAQDEATSVVWGMPGFVVRNDLADRVLPLEQIAPTITRLATATKKPEPVS
ncbi:MAG TPA: chemotaxis response regulator protein-glutamate methylesterase [Jatrophihabitans sp.]|uniref:protein-glutamate methylesterase/protein-glutamine glutaminase n=1 Tax=Jatrophihabitans sp. TaxID=1932789 RepID=UPI002DFF14C9|nr:chemotaxis response regulator protein-glutamate methylesterase [Jatrophihabitans sp.]